MRSHNISDPSPKAGEDQIIGEQPAANAGERKLAKLPVKANPPIASSTPMMRGRKADLKTK
jgi:hypothetical protein